MESQVIYEEVYGDVEHRVVFANRSVVGEYMSLDVTKKSASLKNLLYEIFLPQGYPNSVSSDYAMYQTWDTIQAFCSTLTGIISTESIMKGLGVGNTAATPAAAAITWILKDGTGMVGRIVFAWWKGGSLDSDFKQWRFFADVINDAAMLLEMLLPFQSNFTLDILCVSTVMKALVGVAGGATRAAITQHQAQRGNAADVAAKDGSQETFVNLVASAIGVGLLSLSKPQWVVWTAFIILMVIHVLANYKAVTCMKLTTFNTRRLNLLLKAYITTEIVLSPETVNNKESVILGLGVKDCEICGYNIVIGASIKDIFTSDKYISQNLQLLLSLYKKRKYLLLMDTKKKSIYVILEEGIPGPYIIKSYFHAIILGMASSMFLRNYKVYTCLADSDFSSRIFNELHEVLNDRKAEVKLHGTERQLSLDALTMVGHLVDKEFSLLKSLAELKGWKINEHKLLVNEWRAIW